MPHYMLFRTPVALSTRTSGFRKAGSGLLRRPRPLALLLPRGTRA